MWSLLFLLLLFFICVHSTALFCSKELSLVDLKVSFKKIKCKLRREKNEIKFLKKNQKGGKKKEKNSLLETAC